MPRKSATETPVDDLAAYAEDTGAAPAPEKDEWVSKTVTHIPTRKSLIPELYRTVRTIPADIPYDQLGGLMQSAGWVWRLVERSTTSTPFGSYLVQFDVLIGKATADLSLEYFDTISMSVPAEAPSPSLIARLNAQVALTYMVFGRLPPAPVSAPAPVAAAPEPVVRTPEPEPVEETEWKKPVKAPVAAEDLPVAVIRRRTPDGIPIMGDPYEMNGTPDEIVAAILETFANGAEEANDKTILNTLWSKNDSAVEFVKDFGSVEDKARLRNIFKVRAEQIG